MVQPGQASVEVLTLAGAAKEDRDQSFAAVGSLRPMDLAQRGAAKAFEQAKVAERFTAQVERRAALRLGRARRLRRRERRRGGRLALPAWRDGPDGDDLG